MSGYTQIGEKPTKPGTKAAPKIDAAAAAKADEIVQQTTRLALAERQAADWLTQNLARGRSGEFTLCRVPMSPQLASLILQRNEGNRPVNRRRLAAMIADMAAGAWECNGETIIIARTGELNNGQHRLLAVVQSGVTVAMDVSFGKDRETRHTLDQGTPRRPAQILAMLGLRYTHFAAVAGRVLFTLEKHQDLPNGRSVDCTRQELVDTIARHPMLADGTVGKVVDRIKRAHINNSPALGVAYYLMRLKDAKAADQFFDYLIDGIGMNSKNHPAFMLRRRMLDGGSQNRQRETLVLAIRAWNAWRNKEAPTFFRYAPEAPMPSIE